MKFVVRTKGARWNKVKRVGGALLEASYHPYAQAAMRSGVRIFNAWRADRAYQKYQKQVRRRRIIGGVAAGVGAAALGAGAYALNKKYNNPTTAFKIGHKLGSMKRSGIRMRRYFKVGRGYGRTGVSY